MGSDRDQVRLKQRLKEAIANSKAIQNLADNPLLLAMMAILNRRQELPRDRADLYDQASRVLLYHWDVDHKRLQLPMDAIGRWEKQEMLRPIAYEMQAGAEGLKGNLISADRLTQILTSYLRDQGFGEPREKANLLIQQLRERNFILCYRGADTYGFMHRTFLEYFCAVEIVNRFEKQRSISFKELRDEVFGQHWKDETWHEVLRLICGMISPEIAEKLIKFLMEQTIDNRSVDVLGRLKPKALQQFLLGADCLSEVKNRHLLSVDSMFIATLKGIIQDSPRKVNEDAVLEIIFRIAKNWTNSDVKEWLHECTSLSQFYPVSGIAVKVITEFWRDSPEILPWLKSCAQQSDNYHVQSHAMRMLRKYWKDDPDTLLILKSQISNQNTFVVNTAIQELAQGWSNTPGMFEILIEAAQNDPFGIVESSVIHAVAKFWKNHPDTLNSLKKIACTDENNLVRGTAIQELADGWGNDPEIISILQNRAKFDEFPDVKLIAIRKLTYICKNTSELFEIFNTIVLQDPPAHDPFLSSQLDISPRLEALKSIWSRYPNYPKTIELLRDRAINDPDEQLRQWAQKQLKMQV